MSQDDEDWFEKAVREDEEAEARAAAEGGQDDEDWFEQAVQGDEGETDTAPGPAEPPADSDGDDLFEEDFAAAFESAPGGDVDIEGGGGMGGMGAEMGGMGADMGGMGGGSDFADDEIDSALPRIDLGIEGLDDMIQGGVPERSLMVTIGSAGTGKTTFGLQFIQRALENGEKGVYITLEESRERVLNTATEKGWAWDHYDENGQLAIVDIDPIEMANSLQSIQSELPRLIRGFNASRLVLDSVSLLEMMYEDRATRRNEIWDFTKSLKDAGVTTMMTSEASDETPYASRHGIVEYLADAVFILQYVRPDDFHETRLAIEIQKIRDANHSRDKKPYDLTDTGIEVHQQANIF